MFPELFKAGPVTLYTYGLFIAIGFFAALTLSKKIASSNQVKTEIVTDLFFIILIAALIGSRGLYVIIEYEAFKNSWIDVFKIWNGGLVFYGGFIAAVASALFYLRLKQINPLLMGDIVFPGIALGHAIGRIGCFFAGCCYGKPTSAFFAVCFTHPLTLAPQHVHLHPTQLYSVASNLFIFAVLIGVSIHKRFNGMVTITYLILYAVLRSTIEYFRGDYRGTLLNGYLSTSQGISLLVALAGIILMIILFKRRHDTN